MHVSRIIYSSFVLILILFFTLPPESVAQQSTSVTLAGYKMKPRVATSGSGMATVELKGDTLKVHGDFENLTSNYAGAFLMASIKGEAGNQLYRLKVNLNDEKTGGTLNAKENTFVLSKAEKELLKNGELFITITTFDHQSGELRGDISPMG